MNFSEKVPVTIVVGKYVDSLGIYVISADKEDMLTLNGMFRNYIQDVENLLIQETSIKGHVAITAFGHYVIKAVDVGSSTGTYVLTNTCQIMRLPTISLSKKIIRDKFFGNWVHVRNSAIILGNIFDGKDRHIVLAPARIGEIFVMNIGLICREKLNFVKFVLDKLLRLKVPTKHLVCICRLPSIPIEITISQEDKQMFIRFYLNDLYTLSSRLTVLLMKNNKVVYRVQTDYMRDGKYILEQYLEYFQNLWWS